METAPLQKGAASPPANPDPDQRVVMGGVDWWQYETILAALGDRAGVRVTYLEGQLEIMSPSRTHGSMKTMLARLVEAYAEERGLVFEGYGSMTLKNPRRRRGAEPDECYALGSPKEGPDIAIEVVWTSGGLEKLDVYRGLGVREVWMYEEGRLSFHALRDGDYVRLSRSELVPDLDPALIERFMTSATQTEAVRGLRAAVRAK